jgi:hypothetical protein
LQGIIPQPEPRADVEAEIQNTQSKLRDRRAYLTAYYENYKEKIIDSIKENDKKNNHTRFIRDLENGVILWTNVRAKKKEKYKLSYDEKNNMRKFLDFIKSLGSEEFKYIFVILTNNLLYVWSMSYFSFVRCFAYTSSPSNSSSVFPLKELYKNG